MIHHGSSLTLALTPGAAVLLSFVTTLATLWAISLLRRHPRLIPTLLTLVILIMPLHPVFAASDHSTGHVTTASEHPCCMPRIAASTVFAIIRPISPYIGRADHGQIIPNWVSPQNSLLNKSPPASA